MRKASLKSRSALVPLSSASVVSDKSQRVASFHREAIKALADLIAAAGLDHPRELRPFNFMHRAAPDCVVTFALA